jgi:uncharacterized protein YjbJ (UPF0337 family)
LHKWSNGEQQVFHPWHGICSFPSGFLTEPKGVTAMGREDQVGGKMKQMKGKANDVIGAVKGDTGQQMKGKLQKGVGKVQEKLGKLSTGDRNQRDMD